MHKFKIVGSLATFSLLLAGCSPMPSPSIYELSNPANRCEGSDVFLELSDDRPTFNGLVQEVSTLSVVDANGQPVSTGALDKIEIEYRIGLFGEAGFQMISPEFFSVRSPYSPEASPSPLPLPSSQAFIDLFWDVEGPTSSQSPTLDGASFLSVMLDGPETTGTVSELLGSEAEASVISAAIPGAFLAKCTATGEYVAAVPMFPNTSVDEVAPLVVETDPGTAAVDFSSLFTGPNSFGFINMSIAEIRNQVFSSSSITQRWLNNSSFDISESARTRALTVATPPDFNAPTLTTMEPLPNGTYRAILSYLIATDDDVLLPSKVGTAYYDLLVLDGVYSFVLVVPANTHTGPPANQRPRVDESSQVASVSTKGFRELSLTGENLSLIESASIGGKNAPIVSSNGSLLKLRLPALSAGSYALNLKHSDGEIKNARSVSYVSAKRLSSLELGVAKSRASWLTQSNLLLAKNRNILQVDCVVTLASGASSETLRAKATSICKSLAKAHPGIRTITRTFVGNEVRTGLVLKFWG